MTYQCEKCGRLLTSDIEYRRHVRQHDKEKLTPRPQPSIEPRTQNRDPKNIITR